VMAWLSAARIASRECEPALGGMGVDAVVDM